MHFEGRECWNADTLLSVCPVLSSGPFLLPCYQVGSQPSTAMFHSEENGSKGMDPLVLIDAIAICMAYEEKELCKIGEVALAVIFDVASIILGSKERVRPGLLFVGFVPGVSF